MSLSRIIVSIVAIVAIQIAVAEEKMAPKLTTSEVKDGLYIISGDGGNMAFFTGPEGGVLVDDAFAHTAPAIMMAIDKLGDDMPKYVLNTHYHGDHAGSNLAFGEAGSIIVGHRNVRARLASGTEIKVFNMVTPPAEPVALPSLTYADGMDISINGETVSLFHVENAHTDGDTVMKFVGRNVVHTGDVLFNGFFPFIDVAHGGTLAGYIQGQNAIIDLSDDDTIIIPGHGEITDRAGVIRNKTMLETALKRLIDARIAGKTLEEVVAENPLSDLDEEWGKAMFTSDRWISIVYDSVTPESASVLPIEEN